MAYKHYPRNIETYLSSISEKKGSSLRSLLNTFTQLHRLKKEQDRNWLRREQDRRLCERDLKWRERNREEE